ncbi:MAG: CDP-diacylglycerol--serine O-phosphatidyltransferase [Bacteroidota bacterium]
MRVTRSIVPNLFTLANLLSGFLAIIETSQNNFKEAAIFIVAAGIFDMLDGVMARLINSASELGVELDSLCDAVSFGVAPSYMLYQVYFHEVPNIGALIACLPAMAGVFRLARFNVQLTSLEDKQYFTGMPIPAGALTLISYIVFFHLSDILPENIKIPMIYFVTIVTSLVMVSRIKYDNLPRPSAKSFKARPVTFIVILIGIIGSIFTKGKFLFPFMAFYIVSGAIRHGITILKERRFVDDEDDEDDEDEQHIEPAKI